MLQSPSREVRELGQDLHFFLREFGQVQKDILSPIYTLPPVSSGFGRGYENFPFGGHLPIRKLLVANPVEFTQVNLLSFPGQTNY